MIIEWVIYVFRQLGEWVMGFFPTLDIPASLRNIDDTINGFFSGVDGLGVWFDTAALTFLAAIPLAYWVGTMTVASIRSITKR